MLEIKINDVHRLCVCVRVFICKQTKLKPQGKAVQSQFHLEGSLDLPSLKKCATRIMG